jgi:hypothetical protein
VLEAPVQIVEVRAGEGERPVTITAALTGDASAAILTALSEQLDRRRQEPAVSVEQVLALRDHVALMERFEPLAKVRAGAIIGLSEPELRTCLLELTSYVDRVDGEHFQPVELRERLGLIAQITPVFWDANATAAAAAIAAAAAAAAADGLMTHAAD